MLPVFVYRLPSCVFLVRLGHLFSSRKPYRCTRVGRPGPHHRRWSQFLLLCIQSQAFQPRFLFLLMGGLLSVGLLAVGALAHLLTPLVALATFGLCFSCWGLACHFYSYVSNLRRDRGTFVSLCFFLSSFPKGRPSLPLFGHCLLFRHFCK